MQGGGIRRTFKVKHGGWPHYCILTRMLSCAATQWPPKFAALLQVGGLLHCEPQQEGEEDELCCTAAQGPPTALHSHILG